MHVYACVRIFGDRYWNRKITTETIHDEFKHIKIIYKKKSGVALTQLSLTLQYSGKIFY